MVDAWRGTEKGEKGLCHLSIHGGEIHQPHGKEGSFGGKVQKPKELGKPNVLTKA